MLPSFPSLFAGTGTGVRQDEVAILDLCCTEGRAIFIIDRSLSRVKIVVRDVLSIPKVEEDKCLLLIPVILLDPIIVFYD